VIDTQLVDIKQAQVGTTHALSQSVAEIKQKLEKKVEQLSSKVQGLQDHVDSVEGRLNIESINGQIGDDNIIHGKQWLQTLPVENFVIQLAYVDNNNQLYELASHYNYYLKDTLSYFDVTENGETRYVLLTGNYTSLQQAEEALQRVPRYIDMQRPMLRDVASIKQYIGR
jgi:hypothetical protein